MSFPWGLDCVCTFGWCFLVHPGVTVFLFFSFLSSLQLSCPPALSPKDSLVEQPEGARVGGIDRVASLHGGRGPSGVALRPWRSLEEFLLLHQQRGEENGTAMTGG